MANAMVNANHTIAARKRKVFLRVLAQTASVSDAAKACGYQDTSALQAYRRGNEDFADQWTEALEAAANVLEKEMIRRAKDGVLEPTFYKGAIVGHTRKFSDTLMMFALRGLKPDTYRENARGGNMNVNFGVAFLPMGTKDPDEWQEKAIEMHKGQTLILPEGKPTENTMLRAKESRMKMRRGD